MHTDVLIAGAGPTGLMLANQLARRGVRAMIIDRNAGPCLQTRAVGVQARTLEIYQHLGIAERAVALGRPTYGVNMWSEGRPTAKIPVGEIGRDLSPYPFILILGQDETERLLGETLNDHGIEIQWNTKLVDLVQDADQVTATIAHADGTIHEVTANWVGGCDGGRSVVRELCGIGFPGAPYEHVFYVADTEATGSMVPEELNVYLWRDGFHLFFPMHGTDRWRLVGILPAELRGKEGLTFEDVIPSLQKEAGAGLNFKECSWFSTYRIHHRHAERFRQGRCFLLGDAAHVHSPVGAQGMNTGLQDAYNLAWKLALVISGRADAALLDTYEAERLPVAKRLMETTDRVFTLIVSESRLAGLLRTRVMARAAALAMRVERIRRFMFRIISQTGIGYRRSPLSEMRGGVPEAAPRAGDRFPWLRLKLKPGGPAEDLFAKLDDTRFHLIVIGQDAPSDGIPEMGDMLRVHRVPSDPENERELARVGIAVPSFYLLRPDGHVGLAGTRLEIAALRRYIAERLHFGREGRVRRPHEPGGTGYGALCSDRITVDAAPGRADT